MRYLIVLLLSLLIPLGLRAEDPDEDPNTKYIVEAIDIRDSLNKRFPDAVRRKLDEMVGKKFDPKVAEEALAELRRQLPRWKVEQTLRKGTQKDQIIVVFQAQRRFNIPLSSDQIGLGYHSSLGWSGKLVVDIDKGPLGVGFGFQNDGQEMIERQAGILGYLERKNVLSDRLRLRFDWATQRAQWNQATLRELNLRPDLPGVYRQRQQFAPSLTVAITEPLSATFGFEVNRLQFQFPQSRILFANNFFTELHFDERYKAGSNRYRWQARYRVAKSVGGDFDFTRNFAIASFGYRRGEERFRAELQGGHLSGNAPLMQRFNLGNLTTLRGWNQFDLAPVGGSRMFHSSVQYGSHGVFGYYDAGSVWDPNSRSNRTFSLKHAVGFGFGGSDVNIGVGFPLRSGSISPVFFIRFGN